ncbi:MAG: single-stranded DNA-binding protein [Lachnospiraceae bacterium]|nr:single-stranded DNA-binding protein [Lachnospiraceae bacterium]
MNKVILMGRLTRDPEVRYGDNQRAVGRFSIAVDRRFAREGDTTTDFFNCTAFGKQAEFVEKYLKKGTKMLVTGRVQNDNYTNKEGQTVYSVQIIVEELEFAESKGSQSGSQAAGTSTAASSGEAPAEGFMNVPGSLGEADELPFA